MAKKFADRLGESAHEETIFSLPRLIMCEGADDIAFFQRLIKVRGLPPFHIRSTAKGPADQGGNTKFSEALQAIRINTGFSSIKDILLVSDNDDDHRRSFDQVCQQITKAGFSAPGDALAKGIGQPAITIMMLPLDRSPGNLECVCRAAAEAADSRTAVCSSTFEALLETEHWPISRRGKLWLRANLAARASDPFVSLRSVFVDDRPSHLIPLDHRSFDPIANELAKIAAPLSPPPKQSQKRTSRRGA